MCVHFSWNKRTASVMYTCEIEIAAATSKRKEKEEEKN
jgi:hypothetical protein